MVLMVEQQFVTQMSNWMIDTRFDVFFQAAYWRIFSFIFFFFLTFWYDLLGGRFHFGFKTGEYKQKSCRGCNKEAQGVIGIDV